MITTLIVGLQVCAIILRLQGCTHLDIRLRLYWYIWALIIKPSIAGLKQFHPEREREGEREGGRERERERDLSWSRKLVSFHVSSNNWINEKFLGNGFSDFIIPWRRFRWGILFWRNVCPSFLFPSVRPAMDYGKLTKGTLWSHLPPTTD